MKKLLLLIVGAIGVATGYFIGKNKNDRFLKGDKVYKFKCYYNMLNQWLKLKHEGKSIETYFEQHDYRTIAIYGIGEIGCRVYEELLDTNIEVKYAIDREKGIEYKDLPVLTLEDVLEKVDVIIVTAVFEYEDILEKLSGKVGSRIVSLEDVLLEL